MTNKPQGELGIVGSIMAALVIVLLFLVAGEMDFRTLQMEEKAKEKIVLKVEKLKRDTAFKKLMEEGGGHE